MYLKKGRLGVRALGIMVSNELRGLKSNKQIIYSGILSPVLYFFFYSFGIQSTFGNIQFLGKEVSFLSYSMIGIFAMSLFREMYQCVYRMIVDRRWGLLSLKLLNGVLEPFYIIGICTFPIVGVMVQVILVYCLSAMFGGVFPLGRLFLILLFLIVCVVFWASVLLCIALLIKNYKQRDFVMNTLLLPVLFAAPLFYSLDSAPLFLRIISRLNPLTYQLEAMRSIAFEIPDYTYMITVFVLAAVMFIFASVCLHRADFLCDEH